MHFGMLIGTTESPVPLLPIARLLPFLLLLGVCFFCFVFCFFETGFLCSHGCPGTRSVRPGWPPIQRSAYLCLPSASTKGTCMCHHHLTVIASLARGEPALQVPQNAGGGGS